MPASETEFFCVVRGLSALCWASDVPGGCYVGGRRRRPTESFAARGPRDVRFVKSAGRGALSRKGYWEVVTETGQGLDCEVRSGGGSARPGGAPGGLICRGGWGGVATCLIRRERPSEGRSRHAALSSTGVNRHGRRQGMVHSHRSFQSRAVRGVVETRRPVGITDVYTLCQPPHK